MKTNFDSIPKELIELDQWVCAWNSSKVPMQANQLKSASSTNPSTWSSFQDARDSVEIENYDNVGFVFNDNGIVGIDIDKGFNEDGTFTDLLNDIMDHCKSYTETSRSGRGVHIILKGKLPWKGKNNQDGVEMYQSSRYFLVTGNVFQYDKVIENQEAIDYIIDKYFPETIRESTSNLRKEKIYKPIYKKPSKHCINITPTYPPIPDGMRNLSLTSLGGQLHSIGLSKSEIYRELCKVNKIACNPPLKNREIEMICNSVSRYRRK